MLRIIDSLTYEIQEFDYDQLYENMTNEERNAFLAEIYTLNQQQEKKTGEKRFVLECSCREKERIKNPLTISSRKSKTGGMTYFLRNFTHNSHLANCNFEGTHTSTSGVVKKNPDGTYKMRLRGLFVNDYEPTLDNSDDNPRNYSERRPGQRKRGLRGLAEWLLAESGGLVNQTKWKHEQCGATLEEIVNTVVGNKIAGKIYFRKDFTLQQCLVKGKTDEKILNSWRFLKNTTHPILCGVLNKNGVSKADTKSLKLFSLEVPYKSEPLKIYCPKEEWERETKVSNLVDTPPFFVLGFVNRDALHQNCLQFSQIVLMPLSKEGIYCESSYERVFYNTLHTKGRVFFKPCIPYESFQGMLPDAILIDTQPKTIIEVFGRGEEDKKYTDRKHQKVKHFSSLTKYQFYSWDAYGKEKIPPLPRRHNLK